MGMILSNRIPFINRYILYLNGDSKSKTEGDDLNIIIPEIVSRIMNLVQSNGVNIDLRPKFIILKKTVERISNTLLQLI